MNTVMRQLRNRAHRRAVVSQVLRGLPPERATLADLVQSVGQHLGRPIVLLPCALPAGAISGLWVSRDGRDYIAYAEDASPTRKVAIVCHELGHMLMNHAEKGGRLDLEALLALVAPDVSAQQAARVLARHGYDTQQEAEAEEIGTQLAAHLADGATSPAWEHTLSQHLR